MAAVTDYASLLEAVEDQLERDDLDSRLPRFVQMTEAVMKRQLRTLDMEVAIDEVVPAEAESFALPEDCLSIRAIHIKADQDKPPLPLTAYSPAAFAVLFSGHSGIPRSYTRIENAIRLAPVPEAETTLELLYLARFVPLDETHANWIMERHPDAYFYGACAQALAWDKDEDNPYAALFAGVIEDMRASRARDRWGPGLAIPSGVANICGVRA